MRIVIDMQGAQASNRFRGIGRYAISLAKSIIRNKGDHQVFLALSGLFPDSIEPIRAAFENILQQDNILVWHAPGPVASINLENKQRRDMAELIRESFLASLQPDIVLIMSYFEGFTDDAVVSIGKLDSKTPVSVILYDLIPFIHQKNYLSKNSDYREYYLDKMKSLNFATGILAISESTRQEGLEFLSLKNDNVVNISSGKEDFFRPLQISLNEKTELYKKFGIKKSFILYTGGADERKNIVRLIEAFESIPKNLRSEVQLLIAGKMPQDYIDFIRRESKYDGDWLIFTGDTYLSDNDLVKLYNLCQFFVFPSWHEGFGLPALEAMACGAAVIASNRTSLLEVVGLEEAFFDPYDIISIRQKIEKAILDPSFIERLKRHGLAQAKKFSWDRSAKLAIETMERFVSESAPSSYESAIRPRLAYISPLPVAQSGISDYSAELLPELAKHYEIDLIVHQEEAVSDQWIEKNLPVRKLSWFVKNSKRFDRILYHFGNSHYHGHMFELMEQYPGVIVLHDYFLSGILAHQEQKEPFMAKWQKALYCSHGYSSLSERSLYVGSSEVIYKYSCNLAVLQRALGVITHSKYSFDLARQDYELINRNKWENIPHLRQSADCLGVDKDGIREELGFSKHDFIVCSFGVIGPTKMNHRLLNAWLTSPLAQNKNAYLIFVGEAGGEYGNAMYQKISGSNCKSHIKITGWASEELYNKYLNIADLGIQLRTLSRGETSGTVLDCMNHGIATIVNANGSMAELNSDAVLMLPDKFSDEELISELVRLYENESERKRLGRSAQQIIKNEHNPVNCAEQYHKFIEKSYLDPSFSFSLLIEKLGDFNLSKNFLIEIASNLSMNCIPFLKQRTIFLDISELVQRDSKSGIQRVVRSILREWLLNPPQGYRIEPVYATIEKSYCYAREFTQRFLNLPSQVLSDESIDFYVGDIFYILDLQPNIQVKQAPFYQLLRNQGIKVYFLVYDLLPILNEKYFIAGAKENFTAWLNVVAENDGAICISDTVANDLSKWMADKEWKRQRQFNISTCYLGADIEYSAPTKGMPSDWEKVSSQISSRPTFLMVGTIEPRKGHEQILETFDHLWKNGLDINLVIVGKKGWLVDDFVTALCIHPQIDKKLFWLDNISDENLEKIYTISSCLLAASYGEGFGLPLIEAAKNKLPIVARDIPVFREVAGEHAYYFEGKCVDEIAKSIESWIVLYKKNEHPQSDSIPWLTWGQSARQMAEILVGKSL